MARPFMIDPDQLVGLEGQQYIVLRPTGPVASLYSDIQDTARSSLPAVVSYPNTGHVTLRGFAEPERLDELKALVRKWATTQPPIDVSIDAVDGFPPPFKIPILRLARTPSLLGAYAGLTEMLEATDFSRLSERSIEDWTFHMSIAYCAALADDDWETVSSSLMHALTDPPAETVTEIEFVWFDHGENRETFPLSLLSRIEG